MSPDIIFLFSFMACTFVLGLFIGWALWRFKVQDDGADSQAAFWKQSFEQSRLENWNLEQKYSALLEKQDAAADKSAQPAAPA